MVLSATRAPVEPAGWLAHPTVVRLARALAFALALSFCFTLVTGSGARTASGRLGGDYPAFYVGGDLIASADRHDLYDPAVQARAQAGLFPDDEEGVLAFAYPPHVALAYAPLAALPYRVSYALHTALMLACLVSALTLARPLIPLLQRHFETATIAAIAFYPMFRAITAGQNTALSLLLLVASWRFVHEGRDLSAGVMLGLLLFKPQLAAPLIGLHLLARRDRVIAGVLVTALTTWAISAALLGVNWFSGWWKQATAFAEKDADANGPNAVSILGIAERVFGGGTTAAKLAAAAPILAVTVITVAIWHRQPARALKWPVAAALATALLVSPHAMFYDAGLLVIPLAVLIGSGRRNAAFAAGALWVVAFTDPLKSVLGFTPLFAVVAATFAAVVLARTKEAL